MKSHIRKTGLVLASLILCLTVYAAIRLEFPSADLPGLPLYAFVQRDPLGNPLIFHTGEWAAIPFYHPTDCVPGNFNLLDTFDFGGAFGCPTTVRGFVVFTDPAAAPVQLHARNLLDPTKPVPVWFVRWPELQSAVADDVLTIGELSGLSTLIKGSAAFYHETSHPAIRRNDRGNDQSVIEASGILEDGRRFEWEGTEVGFRLIHVRIVFR
jgi:hypothetical protein